LLEALASGVPVVVSPETGVRAGVQDGVTGFYAEDSNSFAKSVLYLMKSEAVHREMSRAACDFAGSKTWRGVFEQLYRTYETGLEAIGLATSGAGYVGKGHDDYPARSAVLD